MAIKINVQTQRAVPFKNDEALTLVVLKNAVPALTARGEVIRIDAYDWTTFEAAFDNPVLPADDDQWVDPVAELLFTATSGAWDAGVAIDAVSAIAPSGVSVIGDTHYNTANNTLYTATDTAWTADTVVLTPYDPFVAAAKELYALEYLLSAGVSVLAYPVVSLGTFSATDAGNVDDIDILQYRMICMPYAYIEAGNLEDAMTVIIAGTGGDVGLDAQLFLDLAPDTDSSSIPAVTNSSPKIELFINAGYLEFAPRFTSALVTTEGSINFEGIPASLAALAKKAELLRTSSPWLPVAGERNGKVTEFLSLSRNLSTVEKELFQAANINVLVSRVGIGPLFVSQNTQYSGEGTLERSHVTTTALVIKRFLYQVALSTEHLPNNQKTWTSVTMKLRSFLQNMLESEGITSFQVACGEGLTMTEQDVIDGILKVSVNFMPISVVENITFNVVIRETNSQFDVQTSGGVL
jgi:hypothetical protein